MTDLERAIVRTLRALKAAPDTARQTVARRDLAMLLVDLREAMDDWRGKSYAYRQAVRALYSAAGMDAESARAHQAAIRKHVGEVLRERLSPEQVAELGLRPEAQITARRDQKRSDYQLARAVSAPDADVLRVLASVVLQLERIDASRLEVLPPAQRELAAAALARAGRRVSELSELLSAE